MSEIAVREEAAPLATTTLFGTDNPGEVVERASKVARTLAQVVQSQGLVTRIGTTNHVRVEGWTFLGSLLGVFPVVEWTRPVMEGELQVGWEARVEARTKGGEVVGAAEAECLRSERTWKGRDDYALRSMAQTRAVSKALRLPLGFVMQLAGFNPTPAEEIAVIEGQATEATDDRRFPPGEGDVIEDAVVVPSVVLASEPQKKKLNVLVGTLRDGGHITTEQLWRAGGLDPADGVGEDGETHWAPLRDRLSREQAHALIERLTALEARVKESAPTDFAARAAEAQARRGEVEN